MNRILLFAALLGAYLNSYSQKYHRIQANISKEKINLLVENGFEADHFHLENGVFEGDISEKDIAILMKEKIDFKYTIKDLEKSYADFNKQIDKKNKTKNLRSLATPNNFSLGSYGGFYSTNELLAILDQMRSLYPNLISIKSSIGNSVEGRPIYMVKISDNADVDEPESELFLNALHHAREPMSLSQLVYFMWHVLENYGNNEEITTLINCTEMYIVPIVNPDGYLYNQTNSPNGGGMWRKNRKNNGNGTFGVDINRNYGYFWGYNNSGSSSNTGSETFRGTSAFSEPETQAIRNFCNNHDFVASMDFHSYGNYCIYPFGYSSTNNNPEISLFQQLGSYLTQENNFVAGNAYQTVSYVANGAGDDWKYGEQSTKNKIYSFTPEVGLGSDGFYPAQSRIIPLCESTLPMNIKILKLASKFATLNYTATNATNQLNNNVSFSVNNFGLRNPSYTVSLSSASPYVSSIAAPVSLSNMSFQQIQNASLNYTIDSNTPIGTPIDFTLSLDNGHSPISRTFTVVYTCASPENLSSTNIGVNNATMVWNPVNGVTAYNINFKKHSDTNWSPDIISSSTSYTINGLDAETTYQFRVKTANCSTYSLVDFNTLGLCASPANLGTSNITANSAILNWTATNNASTYQVEYKQSSSNSWINSGNTNNTNFTLNALQTATAYDWRVSATCPSGISSTSSANFTTSAAASYCSAKGNSVYYFWIDYFKLGNITRSSGADAGYYNGTSSQINLTANTSNTVTYSAGYRSTRYTVYWRVWIDYNKDGDFSDAGELIASRSSSGTGNYNSNFVVPSTALNGQTRMRIAMKYGAYPSPCETYSYGEVEDYTVNIAGGSNSTSSTNARIGNLASFENDLTFDGKIYPNPVKEELNLLFKNPLTEDTQFHIVDLNGKILINKILPKETNEHAENVGHLLPSVYLLRLSNNTQSKVIRFVKE